MPAKFPCPGRGPHRGRGIWPGTWLFRFSLFVFSLFVVPGRGVLHTPHKRPERGGCRMMGRAKFLPFGAYNIEGRGRCPLTPTSFSYLDTGKRMRKENQGIRDAGQFGQVPDFFVVHFSFSVVLGRAQKHTPHKTARKGRVQDDGKGQIFTGQRI